MAKIRAKITKKPRNRTAKTQSEIIKDDKNVSYETLENEKQTNAESAEFEPLIKEESPADSSDYSLSNLTLAELAELAKPFSNRSTETLKRLKREELIYIITNEKDDYAKTELSNLNRDSKDLIEVIISILSDIKEARGGGNLNALLVRIFRNQGNRISEAFIKLGVSGSIFGWIMCGFVCVLLIIDSVVGLQSISKIFKKQKKDNETESNNHHNKP